MKVYLLGDPASSSRARSSDTAMVVIGVTNGKHLFLLDGFCHKMSLTDKWINFRTLYERWAKAPGVQSIHAAWETFGSGASDVEYFKSQMRKGIEPIWFEIQELARTIKGQESKKSRNRANGTGLEGQQGLCTDLQREHGAE